MGRDEERVHALAVAMIQDCGDEAHLRTLLRAMNLRGEGDRHRAELWERVADIVAELQTRRSRSQYH